jgi:hypothetical protein
MEFIDPDLREDYPFQPHSRRSKFSRHLLPFGQGTVKGAPFGYVIRQWIKIDDMYLTDHLLNIRYLTKLNFTTDEPGFSLFYALYNDFSATFAGGKNVTLKKGHFMLVNLTNGKAVFKPGEHHLFHIFLSTEYLKIWATVFGQPALQLYQNTRSEELKYLIKGPYSITPTMLSHMQEAINIPHPDKFQEALWKAFYDHFTFVLVGSFNIIKKSYENRSNSWPE